ncbi:hypothetical protein SAMN05660242_1141 [Thermoanaerobacterium sp. RBIITD]|nr:hypothetical protein SAMN05660242_1141 [Thermoanaerobacterium sp. RBIITD]
MLAICNHIKFTQLFDTDAIIDSYNSKYEIFVVYLKITKKIK